MELKKIVEIAQLLDLYGNLLTKKQKDVMEQYYNEDLSLSEISENLEISRQAIYDTIKRSEKLLYQYEEQLKFNDLILQKKHDFKNLINGLENLKTSIMSKDEAKMLTKINELIDYCKELSEWYLKILLKNFKVL